MSTDSIDYQALFEQLQRENEGLRINIIKLRNDDISLFDRTKDKIRDIVEHEYFQLYLWAFLMILTFLIVPIMQAILHFIVNRRNDER